MGFTVNDSMVRGDLFTETGKWKYTITLDMTGLYNFGPTPYDAVREAFYTKVVEGINQPKRNTRNFAGWKLVVLEPCHEFSYPVLLRL